MARWGVSRVTGDDDFEPRLGRIRSTSGGRGRSYLQRVLRAAANAGTGKSPGKADFRGNRIGRGAGAGRVLGTRDRYAAFRSRRVLVKSRIVRLGGRGLKGAALHLRYIQRDGVTREGAAGTLYDRSAERADSKAFLDRAEGDRHQFRFIVSPEDGTDYDDLKPFVRRLMERVEADLETKLDWVAVDHHNTGHPHTHIVVRGKNDQGDDLLIAREYISHGMRERASELVTLDLGPKTDLDIEDQLRRQVAQERLTDLDRMLRRQQDRDGEVRFDQPGGVVHACLGLAEETQPGHWQLAPDMEATLRQMGERGDIIKAMHRDLAAGARNLADCVIFDGTEPRTAPLVGKVVSRGLSENDRDSHYLVLEGVDGRVHYVDAGRDLDPSLADGTIAAIHPALAEPRPSDHTVEKIAARNGGRYSAELHRAADATAKPEFIRAHIRRLESLRQQWGLPERQPNGVWIIQPDHARRAMEADRVMGQGRATVLSTLPLERLASANGCTWLDRELVAAKPVPLGDGFGSEVRSALEQRRRWLAAQGLEPLDPGLLQTLRNRELARLGGELAQQIGKPYTALRASGTVSGTYRHAVDLASGRFAVIERSRDFTLVPWRAVLERSQGRMVSGVARGDTISWAIGRQRGPGIT
jgi:type IV secretory pathway VirD2 relaxase